MDLSPLSAVDRSAMRWLRTKDHPDGFALLSGDLAVATVEWAAKGGSLATARTASDSWTLKRGGFLNPHITARSGEELRGRLSVHLNYHQIDVLGGRTYRFHRAGILVPAWKVSSVDGQEVLHLEPVREGRHLSAGAVVVDPNARDNPDLLLLAVISWCFIVLAWFEDEAVVPFEGPEASTPGPA